jgi:hypothetical protein
MRRALIVGIDDYPSAPLAGCVNDATDMATLLGRNDDDSPNFDVKLETAPDQPVTRASLRRSIEELFKDEADVALLYFSGHGTENDLGGYLVTPDAKAYDEGVVLTEVLTWANKSPVREVVILLDCCHSGALGNVPAIDNTKSNIREGVSILTASRSNQAAMESAGGGVFTALVAAALEGGAADVLGNVSVAGIYAYVDESLGPWDQRPLFKSHVSTLVPLRHAQPAVEVATLRQLPEWFPGPSDEFALDPSFEPDAEPHDDDHEKVFNCLQRCRAAKLVEPVGEEHMYFAAMSSKACRLTPLGRHYWRLANEGRI